MRMPAPASHPTPETTGGRLVTVDGRTLPLTSAGLTADARGGLCRVTLRQTFKNPYDEPLAVTYLMPLPADGAVSGYAFLLGDERITGEVDRKQAARERFEKAIVEGHTAGLVEQERSSLFTQELGNVPPRAEVVAELTVDQKLEWLAEGAWQWRFPTVVAPRYLGEMGRVPDAGKITVDVAEGGLSPRMSLALTVRDALGPSAQPHSPSHPIRSAATGGLWAVGFGDEGARLDRDVVVRWAVSRPEPGVVLDVARAAAGQRTAQRAFGLLTLVPPSTDVRPEAMPRDLILLLDTSGSMGGDPLDQSVRIARALVDSLTERDQLEMIEFSNSATRWRSRPVPATEKMKRDAHGWLSHLRASGGTEMRTGILEALGSIRDDAQRQVVLMTDGLIGAEHEVLQAILSRLPRSSRVHAVGVGSAVNRSLTLPAARAGRGVELVIGLGEDVERAAARIVARTCAPLITEVQVSGSAVAATAPERIADLFAGAPAMVAVELRPQGGELVVRGKRPDGEYRHRLVVPPIDPAQGSLAVAALYAREAVEDLELRIAAGEARPPLDERIEALGLEHQISTRLTSWVAISQSRTVDPTRPTRREVMPQELPYGMSVQGLGLRRTSTAPLSPPAPMVASAASMPVGRIVEEAAAEYGRAGPGGGRAPRGRVWDFFSQGPVASKEKGRARKETLSQGMARPPVVVEAEDEGAPATLAGRVVLRSDAELVIEVFTQDALSWRPEGSLRIRTADGQWRTARIDPTRSTAPGELGGGLTLRLALVLDAPGPWSGAPVEVRLTLDGGDELIVSL